MSEGLVLWLERRCERGCERGAFGRWCEGGWMGDGGIGNYHADKGDEQQKEHLKNVRM
jgi:hypothetical protein